MKLIIIILAVILVPVFIVSFLNTYQSVANLNDSISITTTSTVAFDPALSKVSGFEETENRMSAMIRSYAEEEKRLKVWDVLLNLLVTIATGLTALVTAISTARNNALTKSAAITVALVTFITSLISFGQSQVTTEKENIRKGADEVKTVREELESLKPDELYSMLKYYNRALDEIEIQY